MTAALLSQIAMFTAGGCYTVAAFAFVYDGKPWMGISMFLYAICCVTIYLGGRS